MKLRGQMSVSLVGQTKSVLGGATLHEGEGEAEQTSERQRGG